MANLVKKIRTNSGDLQIDYNALANLPTISNPNLLINSDFRHPVNQRLQTSYTFNGTGVSYTIDRWCMNYHSTLIVNDGYVTLQGNTDSNNYWYQHLEHAVTGTFTVSVYVRSITNTNGYMGFYTVDDDNGEYRRFTVSAGLNVITFNATNLNRVGFVAYKTGTIANIEWIKLEQSNVATQFVPRPYGEEMALCRRYYKKYDNNYFIGMGMATSDGIALSLPQDPMRISSPKINILKTLYFNPSGSLTTKFVNLTADYAAIHEHIQLVSFKLGTATPGEIGRIYGAFELDAEIY